MTADKSIRLFLALCAPIAAMMLFALLSLAQTAEAKVRDGKPTPQACKAFGFKPQEQQNSYHPYGHTIPGYAPPPPPPPPPPPQPSQTKAGKPVVVTVTAAKRSQTVQGAPQEQDTERYPNAKQSGVTSVADEPVSTFSIDVDTAAYANVRRFLKNGQLPPRDAVRIEELINYFDYGYAKPDSADVPFRVTTALVASPWSTKRKLLHIGLQGYDIPRAERPTLNLVFLVDTSGSMQDANKLPLLKKALNILIDELRPQDKVAIVAYAGSAGRVLAPTNGNQKLKMRCALEFMEAGGSTAGGAGLALAYKTAQENFSKDSVNRVILLTDGDFNVGIANPDRLEDFVAEKRTSGIYLSVYGLGQGNYNDTMMQALAQNGNGIAGYIDTINEARKILKDDLGGSLFPIADDVKIQIEFNPAAVSEYRLIGYETRALKREDFNNDKVDAGEVGSGASVTAIYELTMQGDRPSSDPLRYSSKAKADGGTSDELGFLKIRYKLPGQAVSKLLESGIARSDTAASASDAPEATRWAIAVTGFGEKLRGSPWIDDRFGWKEADSLARGATGSDPFGLRAEFLTLVAAAQNAKSVNE